MFAGLELEIHGDRLHSTSPQAPTLASMKLKMAWILVEAMFCPADTLEYF